MLKNENLLHLESFAKHINFWERQGPRTATLLSYEGNSIAIQAFNESCNTKNLFKFMRKSQLEKI